MRLTQRFALEVVSEPLYAVIELILRRLG